MAQPSMDRLTSQLNFLPGIIGKMGASIANSQKLLNADFMDNIVKLIGQIDHVVGPAVAHVNPPAADGTAVAVADQDHTDLRIQLLRDLVKALAPSRYQFTETTIDFSADLAETKDVTASGGIGAGLGAVTVNAGLTMGFGYDYRSAARVTCVLHAREIGADLAKSLLDRATAIRKDKLSLPDLSKVEKTLWDQTGSVVNSLFELPDGEEVKPVGG